MLGCCARGRGRSPVPKTPPLPLPWGMGPRPTLCQWPICNASLGGLACTGLRASPCPASPGPVRPSQGRGAAERALPQHRLPAAPQAPPVEPRSRPGCADPGHASHPVRPALTVSQAPPPGRQAEGGRGPDPHGLPQSPAQKPHLCVDWTRGPQEDSPPPPICSNRKSSLKTRSHDLADPEVRARGAALPRGANLLGTWPARSSQPRQGEHEAHSQRKITAPECLCFMVTGRQITNWTQARPRGQPRRGCDHAQQQWPDPLSRCAQR